MLSWHKIFAEALSWVDTQRGLEADCREFLDYHITQEMKTVSHGLGWGEPDQLVLQQYSCLATKGDTKMTNEAPHGHHGDFDKLLVWLEEQARLERDRATDSAELDDHDSAHYYNGRKTAFLRVSMEIRAAIVEARGQDLGKGEPNLPAVERREVNRVLTSIDACIQGWRAQIKALVGKDHATRRLADKAERMALDFAVRENEIE